MHTIGKDIVDQYSKVKEGTEQYYKEVMTTAKCQQSIPEHCRRELLILAGREAADEKAVDHVISGALHTESSYIDDIDHLKAILTRERKGYMQI